MPDNPQQEGADEQQQALAAYHQAVNAVVALGREDYGDATFDEFSQDVADAIGGDAVPAVMAQIVQCDAPQRVIEHLAANPDRAKKLGSMSPARRAAELGRIEAELMPHGSGGGADPAWVTRAKGGEKRGLGDDLSDAQWERNFKKKYPQGFNPYSRG